MTAISAADGGRKTRLSVEGMDCGGCARKIETALGRLPGVEGVDIALATGVVSVVHAARVTPETLRRQIEALGFRVPDAGGAGKAHGACCGGSCGSHAHESTTQDVSPAGDVPLAGEEARPWWRRPEGMLILGSGAAVALAYGVGTLVPSLSRPAFILAALVGLVPVARQAWAAARAGTWFSIEALMTLSASGAILIGAEAEAAAVVFLFLIGEALESLAAGRARAGIRALAGLLPATAHRIGDDGSLEDVPAQAVRVGDCLLIRPGERLPADGVVESGASSVNQAPVTGESVPVAREAGDGVYAGTINGEGVLRIRVSSDPQDNTIARIVRMVEEAQESKAPIDRFIDRFARAYTPAVVAFAAVVALMPPLLAGEPWHEWIYKGLAILLIGCPCALVISTPAAIASALSAGARRGLLMKGGAVLEALGRVNTVAFDKTGTLTRGVPRVAEVQGVGGATPARVLALAAALGSGSNHPLSRAIAEKVQEEGLAVPEAREQETVPGRGVAGVVDGTAVFLGSLAAARTRATVDPGVETAARDLAAAGHTVSALCQEGAVLGLIALRDEPRPEALEGVTRLGRLGLETVMLTGDHPAAAATLGQALNMPVHAELLPDDKVRLVREREARGARVVVVGDGLNDAPALAAASVGIAMGGGTDVALETADAALLHARVTDVATIIALARRTLAIIRQNVALALGLKGAFLLTTLAGITGLWPAVLADTGATVLVTANALRLLRIRERDAG
ncbi:heavy metal translocating P-type ATPase [Pararhodospirillum oryzae]|uniref:P-type Zn(2+) transporter n=1 Tax=Pararhodospirillum oryzae TaxID=478448 RepID=A0A512H9G1_9PROT|nr:heavy metal translocating P-type ATPase [Pararhodospirillum oryzae]GEO82058.1 ATPase [Pararhodospirillum oryzae]